MDDDLVLVTTDPNGGYEDRYVDIAWPMDALSKAQREKLAARARTTIDLGYSSVNYLIMSQAAGYLPRRLVDPFIASGRLHRVADAPVFHSPVYVVRRIGLESRKLDRAVAILRDLAKLAVDGKLPPPFWSQAT
jgi:DNA-binding transcriptional LysR family regulator